MLERERMEAWEEAHLAPYAAKSRESGGRLRPMEPCPLRTDFQRDRDRILHCKSFRRLKYKTQAFLAPEEDHYRTRMTHTLEVSQIARTLARALRLNEDLTEAIALGHDLGHTPFGHAGERTLNRLSPLGFEHQKQSLRVVDLLENEGRGLNLTFAVRDGIVNHNAKGHPATLEGRVVHWADRIAYINHDIDDAIRAGVITPEELPRGCVEVLGATHGQRINTMVMDFVTNSRGREEARMSPTVEKKAMELRAFLFERVYDDASAREEERKADYVLEGLYRYYSEHPEALPPWYGEGDDPQLRVLDYVAGMTDRFAMQRFTELFLPGHAWR